MSEKATFVGIMSEKATFVGIFNTKTGFSLRVITGDTVFNYEISQLQVRALGVDAVHALDTRLFQAETALSSNTAATIGDDNGRETPPTNCPRPTASEAGH